MSEENGFDPNVLRAEREALARDKARWVQSEINLRDVAHECRHGKLPLDRVQTCGCWVVDGRFTPAAVALEHRVQETRNFCQG